MSLSQAMRSTTQATSGRKCSHSHASNRKMSASRIQSGLRTRRMEQSSTCHPGRAKRSAGSIGRERWDASRVGKSARRDDAARHIWIARLPTASAASFTASDSVGCGVAGARDVLGRAAELHRDRRLGDHVAGVGADDVHAEHAVGLGVGEDLHEAVGGEVDLGAAVGGERKLADVVGDAGRLQLLLGLADRGDLRDTCRPRSGSRRSSRGRPGRR